MQIQTFNNMKGVIHGRDLKRIGCDRDGVLRIGSTEIVVSRSGGSVMPLLFHGATGGYPATFTDAEGNTYDLGKVNVRNGRVVPPSPIAVELMELRCRADRAEAECIRLSGEVETLGKVFDTDSLNFLIR